jgi:hypothetical protein
MKKSQITLILIIGGILVVYFSCFLDVFFWRKRNKSYRKRKKSYRFRLDIAPSKDSAIKCVGEEIRKIIENQKTSLMQFAIDGSEYNKGNLVYLYVNCNFQA